MKKKKIKFIVYLGGKKENLKDFFLEILRKKNIFKIMCIYFFMLIILDR